MDDLKRTILLEFQELLEQQGLDVRYMPLGPHGNFFPSDPCLSIVGQLHTQCALIAIHNELLCVILPAGSLQFSMSEPHSIQAALDHITANIHSSRPDARITESASWMSSAEMVKNDKFL